LYCRLRRSAQAQQDSECQHEREREHKVSAFHGFDKPPFGLLRRVILVARRFLFGSHVFSTTVILSVFCVQMAARGQGRGQPAGICVVSQKTWK
jgi:hypothetical protein